MLGFGRNLFGGESRNALENLANLRCLDHDKQPNKTTLDLNAA